MTVEQNIKLVLQYDGSRYDGWQRQGNTENTIQGKIEAVLGKMSGRPVEICGSGRTDAGVHALSQVANFRLSEPVFLEVFHGDTESVKNYMNRYLPEDIRVLEISLVDERFHSRLSAVEKTYGYRVETASKKDVFERKYCYGLGKELDVGRMRRAAGHLMGTHDFKSFCGLKKTKKSTVRTLEEIKIEKQGTGVFFTYRGDGFLFHMVRILTGTLIEIGLGQRGEDSVPEILEALDRQAAGYTVPPEGLFLMSVSYRRP